MDPASQIRGTANSRQAFMKFTYKSSLVAAALMTATTVAGAAEFWSYVPGNGNLTVNNAGGGAGFASVNVTGYNGVGGQFNGNFWDAGAKPGDSFFRFFCIELTEHASAGPNPYSSSQFSDDDLRKLYDVAYPNKSVGDFWNGGQTNFGVFASDVSAAAFQVAVWNIVFDSDLSLSAGSFTWTGGTTAVSTAAQALLDQVAAYSGTGYSNWTLYKFVSPVVDSQQRTGYQNYVSATYKVPEPGTVAMLGLALVGLGAAARRRRD
jgi:hypothetical protein